MEPGRHSVASAEASSAPVGVAHAGPDPTTHSSTGSLAPASIGSSLTARNASGNNSAAKHHRRGRSFEDRSRNNDVGPNPGKDSSVDANWQVLEVEHGGLTSFSAVDTILRSLLADFSEHTKSKLEEIMKFGIVRLFQCSPNDGAFQRHTDASMHENRTKNSSYGTFLRPTRKCIN